MYNYNELQAVELSPTKKDFYQVWSELMEVAGKLSTRWDPTATNESDPGIVLLKVLTAITDKLSYNIDANTLEAFMPSAAQESSMRKLCEMLGYSMQYYKSASTTVRITYKGSVFPSNGVITIDQFTNIKDKNSKTNYITLAPVRLSAGKTTATVECIEGELITCQTENGNVVTLTHLDDNNRFYLPEQQVASNDNCVFIANVAAPLDFWTSTDNLNTKLLGETVYKFGFDSTKGLPYVQFPEDIGSLIGEGLYISFIRTHGIGGNISLNHLQQMEKPASWEDIKEEEESTYNAQELVEGKAEEDMSWANPDLYAVTNIARATNGRNPETIDEAYWHYQKTIGTFDTLVTCRDYMNRIYQMTVSDVDSTPLVSNIVVSDIRDDINRAYTVCTYTAQGLEYTHLPVKSDGKDRINYFDLILYPFETIYGVNTKAEFENSFNYTDRISLEAFNSRLDSDKTIAHQFKLPESSDIVCLKVYFRLNARLATTAKVSAIEAMEIEDAAHKALYKAFNMRNVTFGDEIPYDSILKTLTFADPRIKNVILDDPRFYVVAKLKDNTEVVVINDQVYETKEDAEKALRIYRDLVLKNVLAGKVALFNYDKEFSTDFEGSQYPTNCLAATNASCSKIDPDNESEIKAQITLDSTKPQVFVSPNVGTVQLSLCRPNTAAFSDLLAAISALNVNIYTKGARSPIYTITYSPIISNPTSNPTATDTLKVLVTDNRTGLIKPLAQLPYFVTIPDSSILAMDKLDAVKTVKVPFCQIPFNTIALDDENLVFDKISITTSLNAHTPYNANLTIDCSFNASTVESSTDGEKIVAGSDNQINNQKIEYSIYSFTPDSDSATIRFFWPGVEASTELVPTLQARPSGYTLALESVGHSTAVLGTLVAVEIKQEEGTEDPRAIYDLRLSVTGAVDENTDATPLRLSLPNGSKLAEMSTDQFEVPNYNGNAKVGIKDLINISTELDSNKPTGCLLVTPKASSTCEVFVGDTKITTDPGKLRYEFVATGSSNEFIINTDPVTNEYTYSVGYSYPGLLAREILFRKIGDIWKVADRYGNQLSYAATNGDYKDYTNADGYSFNNSYKQFQTIIYTGGTLEDPKTVESPVAPDYKTFQAVDDLEGTVKPVIFDPSTGVLKQAPESLKDVKVTGITSDFVIYPDNISEAEPLKLATSEVIQFRAPNFTTEMTYPAYVNYYVHLNNKSTGANARSGQSTPAVPATMWTLLDFFNGGTTAECRSTPDMYRYYQYVTYTYDENGSSTKPIGVSDVQEVNGADLSTWCRRASWEEKINSMPTTLLTNIMSHVYTTPDTIKDGSSESDARAKYASYRDTYRAVFVKSASGKYRLFEIPENLQVDTYGIPAGLDFYVLNITAATFEPFIQWLKKASGNITYRDTAYATPINGSELIKGLYSQSRANLSRKSGLLVDSSKFKYELADSLSTSDTASYLVLTTYYVPQLWATANDSHTTDGLGKDAKATGIPANAEYLLVEGEYILFTYSTSEGREDGSTVVKNVALGPGTIVKANFELIDSADKALINRYSKTDNYGPWEVKSANGGVQTILPAAVPGMHAFGATEQLEVRKPVTVELDEAVTNLYWEINPSNQKIQTKDNTGTEYEYFPFESTEGASSYILQAGEYLFYTNAAMENIAYYGAGTEIRRQQDTPPIYRRKQEYEISTEDISNVGLAAAIPWTAFNLHSTIAEKKIVIAEYQIINLAVGDELLSLTLDESVQSRVLSNKFAKVTAATYKCAGNQAELPEFALGDSYFWEARGRFELSLNSSIPQILTAHVSDSGAEQARALVKIVGTHVKSETGATIDTVEPCDIFTITPQLTELGGQPVPVALLSSVATVAPDGNFAYDVKEPLPTLKLCEQKELTVSYGVDSKVAPETCNLVYESDLAFAAYDLTIKDGATTMELPLNILLKSGNFGLLTFYLLTAATTSADSNSDKSSSVRLVATPFETSTKAPALSIFNNYNDLSGFDKLGEADIITRFSWWSGLDENGYTLKPGLNIVVVPSSCKLSIRSEYTKSGEILMISKLKQVPFVNQLNPQLAFESFNQDVLDEYQYDTRLHFTYKLGTQTTDTATPVSDSASSEVKTEEVKTADLMVNTVDAYLWLLDHSSDAQFFYTNEPSNVSGLDLNAADVTDTLKNPKNWFDAQNIANKFVVSQLDADHLTDYIAVSKFSKLY